jgi:hypothetical protein
MRIQGLFLAGSVVLGALSPQRASGQTTVVQTSVRDSTGAPVLPSRIDVVGTTKFALGDSLGRVMLRGIPFGRQTLRVQGMGYSEKLVEIDARSDSLQLQPIVLRRNPLAGLRLVVY